MLTYDQQTQIDSSYYLFKTASDKYNLQSRLHFFTPYRTLGDIQKQFQTTLVAPVIGLMAIPEALCDVIKGLLIMCMSVPCLSPSLFKEGMVDVFSGIIGGVVTPIHACFVTLASLVSLFTRTLATLGAGISEFSFSCETSNGFVRV